MEVVILRMKLARIIDRIEKIRRDKKIEKKILIEGLCSVYAYDDWLYTEKRIPMAMIIEFSRRLDIEPEFLFKDEEFDDTYRKVKYSSYHEISQRFLIDVGKANTYVHERPKYKNILFDIRYVDRMIFLGILGTIECYMKDVVISLINDSISAASLILKNVKKYKDKKIKLSELANLTVEDYLQDEISYVSFTNYQLVSDIYSAIFGKELVILEKLSKFSNLRNIIAHRNGVDLRGRQVEIDSDDLEEVISSINDVYSEIDKAISTLMLLGI